MPAGTATRTRGRQLDRLGLSTGSGRCHGSSAPASDIHRETTSNTNLLDYQTRRGNIRYRIGAEKGFPHTISATGFTDRVIAAILENYQQADGSVEVPGFLRSALGGLAAIRPRGSVR